MTTGEGGAVATEDDELARRLRLFRTHGITKERRRPFADRRRLVLRDASARLQLPDHRLPVRARSEPAREARRVRRGAERHRRAVPGAPRRARSGSRSRPPRPTGWLHGYHLFLVRVLAGAEARLAVFDAHARRPASASRCTTSRSTGSPTTGTSSGIPQDECPAAEDYYEGAISLPVFPAMNVRRRRTRSYGRSARLSMPPDLASDRFDPSFAIDGRRVGGGAPAYVIAEAGANHNRDLGIAKELIDAAADAGADAVKFQTYTGAPLFLEDAAVHVPEGRAKPEGAPRRDRPATRVAAGARRARSRPRGSLSSRPRSTTRRSTVPAAVGVPAMKIASFEIVDLPLIAGRGLRGRPGDPLHRHGDLRRDRGRAARGPGHGQSTRWRCSVAPPSIRLRRRS